MRDTNKDDYVDFLRQELRYILFKLEILDREITSKNLQNEQFILDFYDKLNEISVRK